jgi:hypothetical protein
MVKARKLNSKHASARKAPVRDRELATTSTCPFDDSMRSAKLGPEIRGLANVLQMGGFVAPADGVDAVVQGVGNAWR